MTTRQPAQEYAEQSRAFLQRAQKYLAEDDLHQASEKGWGAAAHMAKAVAASQGWSYDRHEQFWEVIHQASIILGDRRLQACRKSANELHVFFYWRKEALNPETIEDNLSDIESLLQALEPLAVGGG